MFKKLAIIVILLALASCSPPSRLKMNIAESQEIEAIISSRAEPIIQPNPPPYTKIEVGVNQQQVTYFGMAGSVAIFTLKDDLSDRLKNYWEHVWFFNTDGTRIGEFTRSQVGVVLSFAPPPAPTIVPNWPKGRPIEDKDGVMIIGLTTEGEWYPIPDPNESENSYIPHF